ncbi:glutathione S-transferase N-terminal domain-containing protein [Shewanella marina]|uniref:glutathione S-transferase N-terminal domain-containing protein n=1 Tax=Shewanella marina TaxID=487319 RepID=UPI000472BBF4|nr:glutathione S-transferase N-terminal domain-containing protein [Shewanella marina]
MKFIRWILARLILFFNFAFPASRKKHNAAVQQQLDLQTQALKLYQYPACPFCVKVRRGIRRLGLNIELVDAKQEQNKQILASQGGKIKVPCLRIEQDNKVTWLYESNDILAYLQDNYGQQ